MRDPATASWRSFGAEAEEARGGAELRGATHLATENDHVTGEVIATLYSRALEEVCTSSSEKCRSS